MNVAFVNYGFFGNNSSHHIEGFATRLAKRGHRIAIIAERTPETPMTGVLTATPEEVARGEAHGQVKTLLADRSTLLHTWTPREAVRKAIAPLTTDGLRYVVHLEDDETLVATSELGLRPGDRGASSARDGMANAASRLDEMRKFLAGAAAVTLITPGLASGLPEIIPWRVIEPGIDSRNFAPRLSLAERRERRSSLGYEDEDTVIVYHGNVHQANQRDVFSLYTAIRMLRDQGLRLHLLRTGMSENTTRHSSNYRRADGVTHLGCVAREEIADILDLADLYIQPGWINPFNTHRLPSKLLEFMAMGRPVITSKVNLGTRLTDGRHALVVPQGGAPALAAAVRRLLSDPAAARQIGAAGRTYVQEHFDWNDKVDQLERFYSDVLSSP